MRPFCPMCVVVSADSASIAVYKLTVAPRSGQVFRPSGGTRTPPVAARDSVSSTR